MDNRNKTMKNVIGNIFKITNMAHSLNDSIMGELTLKQWLVVLSLINEPTKWHTLNEMANKVGVTRQSMKKMAEILNEKAYIEMAPSKTDKRAYQIKITKKAIKFFENNKDDFINIMAGIFENINDEDLMTLDITLDKMKNNMK